MGTPHRDTSLVLPPNQLGSQNVLFISSPSAFSHTAIGSIQAQARHVSASTKHFVVSEFWYANDSP